MIWNDVWVTLGADRDSDETGDARHRCQRTPSRGTRPSRQTPSMTLNMLSELDEPSWASGGR